MTQALVKQPKEGTLREMLTTYKGEIAHALPRHVSPDRMLRMALTSARKNPELLECTPESFLGAVIQSAQLGLEPDTPLGHAHLIPFRNKNTTKKEVNFMPGYRGLMDLVYRAPDHPNLMPQVVWDGDRFEYELGLYPKLIHEPMPRDVQPKLLHVYCVATWKDGRKEFMVMNRLEVESIRTRSKATGFSPWKTDYDAMAMKTVIRKMVKYLPMSAELNLALGLDEVAERGESQHNENHLKSDTAPILTKAERVDGKMAKDPESFESFEKDKHGG